MQQLQAHPGSYLFRHRRAFEFIIENARARKHQPRILLFGSSWGAEAVPFALALPGASITCAEIVPEEIEKSRRILGHLPNIKVIESDWNAINDGPGYDVILCNAVLCRHPDASSLPSLRSLFPFEQFEEVVDKLDRCLNQDGIITLYNTNYHFSALQLANNYIVQRFAPTLPFNFTDNVTAMFHAFGRRLYIIHDLARRQFIDVSEKDADKQLDVISKLNDNMFIKRRGAAKQGGSAHQLSTLGLVKPTDGQQISFVPSDVFGHRRISPGFFNVPVEQIVRIVGENKDGPVYEITHWWKDEAMCLPFLTSPISESSDNCKTSNDGNNKLSNFAKLAQRRLASFIG